MGTKNKIMERIGKRMDMVNESLPPLIIFNEFEVFDLLCELADCKTNDVDTIPPKLVNVFQKALKNKGRNLNPPNPPEGAMS